MIPITTSRQIGHALREKRRALGMTQQELADAASVSRSLVMRLEKGSATALYPEKLFGILDALGLQLVLTDGASQASPAQATCNGEAGSSTADDRARRTDLVRTTLSRFTLDEKLLEPHRLRNAPDEAQ